MGHRSMSPTPTASVPARARARARRAARAGGTAVAAAALVLVLAGCVPSDARILTLDATEIQDPPCTSVRDIPADELDDADREPCVPLGSTIVFPAGERLEIGDGGGGGTSDVDPAAWIAYSTVGDHGVIAGRYGPGCTDLRVWGPAEALEVVRAAFGQRWPCDP